MNTKKSDLKIESRFKVSARISEQEQLIINRIEEMTKDEEVNLENLLGFINQK